MAIIAKSAWSVVIMYVTKASHHFSDIMATFIMWWFLTSYPSLQTAL